MTQITKLTFEGGGVKGAAYAGAIQPLDLSKITQVAGTSAGAIMASLVAVRFTAGEIKDLVFNLNFSRFKDSWWIPRILTRYGIYKGDNFLQWIEGVVATKLKKKNATFNDLRTAGGKDLCVVATNLSQGGVQVFSYAATPDVIISEAVRASMSIPIFFDAFSFTQGYNPNDIFVDGGLFWNNPIEIFDTSTGLNPETLGLVLWDFTPSPSKQLQFYDFSDYVLKLVDALTSSESVRIKNDPANAFRTVKIDDFGISATDFNITTDQKQQLYNSGLLAVQQYLRTDVTNNQRHS